MGIYVNNKLDYTVNGSQLNTTISLPVGTDYTAVQEWDYCGGSTNTPENLIVKQTSAGVTVTSPANGSTVASPVSFSATATSACAKGVAAMGIYVNNKLSYTVNGSSLNTSLPLPAGADGVVVQDWDYCGGASTDPLTLHVGSGQTGVSVSSPANNSSVTSPVNFVATASSTCAKGVASMGIYVDNKLSYTVNATSLNTSLSLPSGAQNVAVQEWDYCGGSLDTPLALNVRSGAFVPGVANVATWHMDTNRSGLNANEQILTPANVTPQTFGKLFSYLVDGYVYAEPLLMSNIDINGTTHNVLYAATEHDTVYAFDADNYGTGAPLWQTSVLQSGEKPMTNGPIQPYQGITSTPVIDPATGTMYVVSAQAPVGTNNSTFRLSALDITTGAQKFGGPVTIQASVPGTNEDAVNGIVSLTTACVQRAALLLANGNVYIGFGGCHSGWLLAYNAKTLTQVAKFNASPYLNGEGPDASAGGVWMGGGGPASDSAGNVYVTTGNGPWDGKSAWGDSVLKFNAQLQLLDYFTPDAYAYMNCTDADLASGGLLLIPGTTEALAGGKTGKLYLVNTDNLGKEQANDAGATQTLWFENSLVSPYTSSCSDSTGTHTTQINSYENFGTAAYFNGSVYVGVSPTLANVPAGVGQFLYSGMLTPGGYTGQSTLQHSKGTTPFISADGTANGILWMIDQGVPLQQGTSTNATLRAYPADNMGDEIYNSSANSSDVPGYGIKFTSPIVANGKVYISTGHDLPSVANPMGELDVYGLK